MLVDGKLIFSKAQVHRFPADGEVEQRYTMLKEGKELPPLDASAAPTGIVGRVLGKLFS